ncbi:MAG: tetratricopeptide repeat protein [bacterium]
MIVFRNLTIIFIICLIALFTTYSINNGYSESKKDTKDIENLFEQGNKYLENGDIEKALDIFKKIINIDSNNALAHNNLGLVYKEKGLYYTAMEEFQKSIELMPYYYKAMNNLGSVLYLQGNYEEAIEEFKKAINSKPDFDIAHFNIALCYEKLGDNISALKHWRQFIICAKESPYLPFAQLHIDELLSKQKISE